MAETTTSTETTIVVRAHYSADAGREGWTYGLLDTRTRRGSASRTWLTVPGSAYGVTLHASEDAARAAMRQQDETLRQLLASLGEPELATKESLYVVRRVRSVWRYGRNWFEVLDPASGAPTEIRIGKRAYRALDMGRTGPIVGKPTDIDPLVTAGLAVRTGTRDRVAELTDLGRRMLADGRTDSKGRRVLTVADQPSTAAEKPAGAGQQPPTGTKTPYRLVKREWGGWNVVRADNGRPLGWLVETSPRDRTGPDQSWQKWAARVDGTAFWGDGPGDEGNLLDETPRHLIGYAINSDSGHDVIGVGRTRDDAVFELLLWLDQHRAPAVGYGRHPEVRRWVAS